MFFTLFILIPIAVVIDVSEKVDKFLRHPNLSLFEILYDYYLNFILYYGNTFLPLATFIACILFTSKMANNTEVVAISSANISFTRFLRPFFMGATVLMLIALSMNHFVVPRGNGIKYAFEEKYIFSERNIDRMLVQNFNLQLNDSTKIFIKNFVLTSNRGFNFSHTLFRDNQVKEKIVAESIVWRPKTQDFEIRNFYHRKVGTKKDIITRGDVKYMKLDFSPSDLLISDSKSMEMTSDKLNTFIDKSEKRGVKNLNAYKVELYQRTSLPISSYVLTLIAVALASRKKRGGTGINLAIGLGLMFMYVFFMKVAKVLGSAPDYNPLIMAWLPNIVFASIAIYLYINEKKKG